MAKVRNVNTTDIHEAIRLGCRTMQSIFNADDDNVPFFLSEIWPEPGLKFNYCHSEAHVPGRHLNALLSAEGVAGITLDETAVENHRRAAFLSYSGPVALPLNRQEIGDEPLNFCPHNLREGMHALYALVRYRADDKAREMAEQNIAAMFDLWDPGRGWDVTRLEKLGLNYQDVDGFILGEARLLGPLVKYYRATGYAPALELALVLKDKAPGEFYLEDGGYSKERFITHHAHSITCVLSSLAQLADLLDDDGLLARVKAFYDNGLWEMRNEIGWSAEVVGQEDSDHGECNNTGDILETALILGRAGFWQYYEDAERILRCHLLPAQLRDVSFIKDPPNPDGEDGLRNLADRHLGAFGFPAPYGHKSVGKGRRNLSFNMDIVGGTVGSLCEALREVVTSDHTGHRVNMLFDCCTDAVEVESPYTHDSLSVRLSKPGPLFVRIPSWVRQEDVRIEGSNCVRQETDNYLLLADVPVGKPISFHFPLKEQQITLSDRVHIQPIRVRLRGDSVVAMEAFGADLTFFDPYDEGNSSLAPHRFALRRT